MTSSVLQVQENTSSGQGMSRWWVVVGGLLMNMCLGTFYHKVPRIRETRAYVRKVLRYYAVFRSHPLPTPKNEKN